MGAKAQTKRAKIHTQTKRTEEFKNRPSQMSLFDKGEIQWKKNYLFNRQWWDKWNHVWGGNPL